MLTARVLAVSKLLPLSLMTEWEQCSAAMQTARARQAGPGAAPTAFQISGRAHVLKVVHINDIDDRGHNPSPVLKNKSTKDGSRYHKQNKASRPAEVDTGVRQFQGHPPPLSPPATPGPRRPWGSPSHAPCPLPSHRWGLFCAERGGQRVGRENRSLSAGSRGHGIPLAFAALADSEDCTRVSPVFFSVSTNVKTSKYGTAFLLTESKFSCP